MYIVVTRVKLLPGTQERCAELFRRTNPELVRNHTDWLGAQMLFDEESQTVTVLATWRDIEAYTHLANSHEFQNTMKAFASFFAAPPDVSVHSVMVDVKP